MGWIRYQEKWAAGPSPWQYRFSRHKWTDSEIKSFVSDIHDDNLYSQGYRGCDIEKVDHTVPIKEIIDRIKQAERTIMAETEIRQKLLEQLLSRQIDTYNPK
jgi:hypothetical protein